MKSDNYINQITNFAGLYNQKLVDKAILFIYQENNRPTIVEVKFKKENFKHLTGVMTELKPVEFFDNCINHKLRKNSYIATPYTPLKLSVFPTLVQLPENPASIGDYNGTNIHLQLDIVIAKYMMILGLSKDNNGFYFPSTLLKEKNLFNYFKNQRPILLTLTKNIDSAKTEYSLSYVNKNYDLEKVISELPDSIKATCQSIL